MLRSREVPRNDFECRKTGSMSPIDRCSSEKRDPNRKFANVHFSEIKRLCRSSRSMPSWRANATLTQSQDSYSLDPEIQLTFYGIVQFEKPLVAEINNTPFPAGFNPLT